MIIIIPLGGIGERFKKNNYTLPKSFINIFGEPIIHYLLDNLNFEQIEYVYIPYNIAYFVCLPLYIYIYRYIHIYIYILSRVYQKGTLYPFC